MSERYLDTEEASSSSLLGSTTSYQFLAIPFGRLGANSWARIARRTKGEYDRIRLWHAAPTPKPFLTGNSSQSSPGDCRC